MKIDLSKYPPGTKFKLCNEKIVTLIGKSFTSRGYIIEYPNGNLGRRDQEGKQQPVQSEWDIASVFKSNKYLVSYLTERDEIGTIVLPIENPKALNEAFLLSIVSCKTSSMMDMIPGCSNCAVKILSWSKIEE